MGSVTVNVVPVPISLSAFAAHLDWQTCFDGESSPEVVSKVRGGGCFRALGAHRLHADRAEEREAVQLPAAAKDADQH